MRNLILTLAAAATLLAQQPPKPPAPKIPAMPADVQHDRDVEYSNVGQRVAMDIVRPKNVGPNDRLPTVLFIHGGGFRGGNRESYLPQAIKLAQRGYVAATASYRLSPRHQFPAAVEDVKAAVRFLRANAAKYNVDGAHIGTMGGSAGGHLVLMLGLTAGVPELEGTGPNRDQSSAVQCVVNYYGPTDFTQSYQKSVDAAIVLPMWLGGDLNHNRKIHQMASPINWVTPRAAPTLSIHGTEDTYVAYEHSLWITERLINAGVPAELETITGAGHGFRNPADAQRAEARAFAWFDKYLKGKPETRRILVSDHGPKGEIVAMEWPTGKELWTKPNTRGHDVQSLPNGHVLFTVGQQKKVVEIDDKQQVVWEYGEGLDHPLAAERLPNGNTLIGDAKAGRVIEVSPDKKVVWEYKNPDLANMRMRNTHITSAGTKLIAIEAEAKLIEVDKSGKIIWSWQADNKERKLYMGRRLANGNTMLSLSDPGEIVEVSPDGKIVRSIAGKNLDIQFGWASGFVELPGGNLLINDYTGRRLVEVDPKGVVVNELRTGPRTIASVDYVR